LAKKGIDSSNRERGPRAHYGRGGDDNATACLLGRKRKGRGCGWIEETSRESKKGRHIVSRVSIKRKKQFTGLLKYRERS